MQVPLEIDFRNVKRSDAVSEHIHEKADKLEQFSHHIISCHVTLEQTQPSESNHTFYRTNILVEVPGKELDASHDSDENLYVTIKEAFQKITRQVEDYKDMVTGHVKHHKIATQGTIVRLFEDGDYGFIEDNENNEFYFHADNVVKNQFFKLNIGDQVSFLSHIGDEGLQAHHVKLIKNVKD